MKFQLDVKCFNHNTNHFHSWGLGVCPQRATDWCPLVLLLQNLAAQKSYNKLNMSMREALASRACCMEGVLKCYRHETLETVIDRIAKAEVGGVRAPGPAPRPRPLAISNEATLLFLLFLSVTSCHIFFSFVPFLFLSPHSFLRSHLLAVVT